MKHRKIFAFLALILLIGTVSVIFSSCNQKEPAPEIPSEATAPETPDTEKPEPSSPEVNAHTHTFSAEWASDATYHWHAATCEHTDEVRERAAHTYVDGICSVCGRAMSVAPTAGLTFKKSEDGKSYSVSGIGDCKDTDIAIPEVYNNLPVTGIEEFAFSGCADLTSVIIPSSVANIGKEAFSDCTRLASVAVPEGVKTIGDRAFYNCRRMTVMVLPQSVTSIGSGVFSGCSSLEELTVPFVGAAKDITESGETTNFSYFFKVNNSYDVPTSLQRVTVNGGMIHDKAFLLREYLTSVILNGITDIGGEAFRGCTDLKEVTISGSITSIGDSAFWWCTGLTSLTISEGVTSIGSSAFSGCTGLTSLTIPKSVTSIGERAFYGCTGLTSLTIPESVTSISNSAFSGCTGLTSLTIPESVTSISNSAFYKCTGLTSLTIPGSVTSIGNSAFYGCTGLTSVTIPESVKSIDHYAFYNCTGLTSVKVPKTTNINSAAFPDNCTIIRY